MWERMTDKEAVSISQVLQLAPTMVPDDTSECCMACRKAFSFFFRRHHCRFCGRLLCADCTAIRIDMVVSGGSSKRMRACEKCLDTYTKMLQATREQRALQAAASQPKREQDRQQTQTQTKALDRHSTQVSEEVKASRRKSFDQTSNANQPPGRPFRSNTIQPNERKNLAAQTGPSTNTKKISYRKSLRSARSERMMKTGSISAASAAVVTPGESRAELEQNAAPEFDMISNHHDDVESQESITTNAAVELDSPALSSIGETAVTSSADIIELDSSSLHGDLASPLGSHLTGTLPDIKTFEQAPRVVDEQMSPPSSIGAFEEGASIIYIAKNGEEQLATVLKVHYDDYPHFYYTIRLKESGRERQTHAVRLRML